MDKKQWLDALYWDISKQYQDFKLSILKKNKDGSVFSSKWYKYSECCFDTQKSPISFEEINNRQILPNEIVLDLENKESLKGVIEKLKKIKEPFTVFDTGSRGVHIHIFCKRQLTNDEKLKIIKKFDGDEQKIGNSTIALEYARHWKSRKIKEMIYDGTS